ncbi:NUDIX domain-containing protein [Kitasatospora sp. NPDC058063]|uniref:NUDIX domain-containing protein n=1 Tax=unclassified Kitasatospora TaxID=2633591 RepID=UPI0036D9793C
MAHSDIAPDQEPRRRLGCVTVLTREDTGAVLMVRTTYRVELILPGGAAHEGESIAAASRREAWEEIGLTTVPTHFLALDQTPANEPATEGLNVVIDGGTLTASAADALSIPAKALTEIAEIVWVHPRDFDKLAPYQARRIRQALAAREAGHRLPLLFLGEPVAP